MSIEDLVGHMHEDILGQMRGNVKAPEPRQEDISPEHNPFPGADIVQPPRRDGDVFKFHQVKNKTGSAKGGDGERLGRQLLRLKQLYGGNSYYDALIGKTLRGHRSRRGVEQVDPDVAVLVGAAAFQEITGFSNGPQLLLRVYVEAFQPAARQSPYQYEQVIAGIVKEFQDKAAESHEGFLGSLLIDVTEGAPHQQDSRLERRARVRRNNQL
jgi:hypothetical protein